MYTLKFDLLCVEREIYLPCYSRMRGRILNLLNVSDVCILKSKMMEAVIALVFLKLV